GPKRNRAAEDRTVPETICVLARVGAAGAIVAVPGSRAGRNALPGLAADPVARRAAAGQRAAVADADAAIRPVPPTRAVPLPQVRRGPVGSGRGDGTGNPRDGRRRAVDEHSPEQRAGVSGGGGRRPG